MHSIEQLVPGEGDEQRGDAAFVGDLGPEDASDAVEGQEPDTVAYKVIGRQRVDEARKGDTLHLDPNAPRTARLLDRGQIARANTTQED